MEIRQRQRVSLVQLDLVGRLIAADEDCVLKDKVNSLLLQGHRAILLNLEGVSQVDTSGLSALIAIRQAADRNGGSIKLLKLPARVHSLLVVTKLITMFDVFDSEEDAMKAQSVEADGLSPAKR
jgi:anti-sigma B factor antagonist